MAKRKQFTWRDYEREKARLRKLNLSPREYEQRLQALLERLKL